MTSTGLGAHDDISLTMDFLNPSLELLYNGEHHRLNLRLEYETDGNLLTSDIFKMSEGSGGLKP